MNQRTWRRTLSAFLVLLMLVNVIMPANVSAQETSQAGQQENSQPAGRTYCTSGLEIAFQITSQWAGALSMSRRMVST